MFSELLDHVRYELTKLVPSSVTSNLACFVFYDNHPTDNLILDISVCTKTGELIEYYKREIVCSINLSSEVAPRSVKILRNSNSLMFYLVEIGDDLLLLSRTSKINFHRTVSNVERYEFDDMSCRGQACLRVYCKDDAVPMVLDDDFESLGEKAAMLNALDDIEALPMITNLMTKLTETKYTIKCNEQALDDFLRLRQMSALSLYNKVGPSTQDSVFKRGMQKMGMQNPIDLKSYIPWVKMCNKKIIIMLTLSYTGEDPLEDVHMVLHGTSRVSMIYNTRLFEKLSTPPFWKEKSNKINQSYSDIAITAVISCGEMKHVITNKIEFKGAIVYMKLGKEALVPFDYFCISGEEFLGQEYDVLNSSNLDEMTCLAILASTTRTDMIFRHIRQDGENSIDMPELFSTYLHMTPVQDTSNIVIHSSSPYHVLNGVMLVFTRDEKNHDVYNVLVYVRSSSQINTLMYYVHQTIPLPILITTNNQRISMKYEHLYRYNEELISSLSDIDYNEYALSIIHQVNMIVQYLDGCIIKMSESKNTAEVAKIGSVIDIFAQGIPKFIEFHQNLLSISQKGVRSNT